MRVHRVWLLLGLTAGLLPGATRVAAEPEPPLAEMPPLRAHRIDRQRPPAVLELAVSGPGRVGILPGEQSCPSSKGEPAGVCRLAVAPGTRLVLVPEPTIAGAFQGFGGACQGQRACTVTVQGPAPLAVSAPFVDTTGSPRPGAPDELFTLAVDRSWRRLHRLDLDGQGGLAMAIDQEGTAARGVRVVRLDGRGHRRWQSQLERGELLQVRAEGGSGAASLWRSLDGPSGGQREVLARRHAPDDGRLLWSRPLGLIDGRLALGRRGQILVAGHEPEPPAAARGPRDRRTVALRRLTPAGQLLGTRRVATLARLSELSLEARPGSDRAVLAATSNLDQLGSSREPLVTQLVEVPVEGPGAERRTLLEDFWLAHLHVGPAGVAAVGRSRPPGPKEPALGAQDGILTVVLVQGGRERWRRTFTGDRVRPLAVRHDPAAANRPGSLTVVASFCGELSLEPDRRPAVSRNPCHRRDPELLRLRLGLARGTVEEAVVGRAAPSDHQVIALGDDRVVVPQWGGRSFQLSVQRAPLGGSLEQVEVEVPDRHADGGDVHSEPPGILCRSGDRFSACSALFPAGTPVRLVALPRPGQRLVGWSGGCRAAGAECHFETASLASGTGPSRDGRRRVGVRFESRARRLWRRHVDWAYAFAIDDRGGPVLGHRVRVSGLQPAVLAQGLHPDGRTRWECRVRALGDGPFEAAVLALDASATDEILLLAEYRGRGEVCGRAVTSVAPAGAAGPAPERRLLARLDARTGELRFLAADRRDVIGQVEWTGPAGAFPLIGWASRPEPPCQPSGSHHGIGGGVWSTAHCAPRPPLELVGLDRHFQPRWHRSFPRVRDRLTPGPGALIGAMGGQVLFQGRDAQGRLAVLALDARTGTPRWERPLGLGEPAFLEGSIRGDTVEVVGVSRQRVSIVTLGADGAVKSRLEDLAILDATGRSRHSALDVVVPGRRSIVVAELAGHSPHRAVVASEVSRLVAVYSAPGGSSHFIVAYDLSDL